MSIVTNLARLSTANLQTLQTSPSPSESIFGAVDPDGEVLDLDRTGEVIAWLLSPRKRIEQLEFAAECEHFLGNEPIQPPRQPIPPLDDFAVFIEGRGPRKLGPLDAGYGPACHFEPDEVARFAAALAWIDEAALRRELNFELMDTLHLPVEYWVEEGEETFKDYILPNFERLKRFYTAAATAGQSVLVWHS